MVDDLGVEKLQEYKLLDDDAKVIEDATPDDFAAEDADALADTIVGCVDVEELLNEQMGATMEQMTDEQAACITEAFDEDTIKDIISGRLPGRGRHERAARRPAGEGHGLRRRRHRLTRRTRR